MLFLPSCSSDMPFHMERAQLVSCRMQISVLGIVRQRVHRNANPFLLWC